MSKLSKAWDRLFDELKIIKKVNSSGYYDLDASEIKKITGEEPRLMAKWDHSYRQPEVFKKNGLGLLPLSVKTYRIGHFNLFEPLKTSFKEHDLAKIHHRSPPGYLQTLRSDIIDRSESVLMSACYTAGVFEHFLGLEEHSMLPTIYGRLRTNKINCKIGNSSKQGVALKLDLKGVQFEIDGGYESEREILLVEAKNSYCEDFNIRQLYIPWRYVSHELVKDKPVHSVFMMRSNALVHLYQYDFPIPDRMDSIKLVQHKSYSLMPFAFTNEHLIKLLASQTRKRGTKTAVEDIPFPQSNNFNLVLQLCEYLHSEEQDSDNMAEFLEYDKRQAYYYGDAARFLGLVEKRGSKYFLSKLGREMFAGDLNARLATIVKSMLQWLVFRKTLSHILNNKMQSPAIEQVADWIMQDGWPMNATTAYRRAGTVLSWCRWVLEQTTDA